MKTKIKYCALCGAMFTTQAAFISRCRPCSKKVPREIIKRDGSNMAASSHGLTSIDFVLHKPIAITSVDKDTNYGGATDTRYSPLDFN